MDFYTDVQVYGNSILLRGVKNGTRYSKKVPYQPTLYVSGREGNFKTIDGQTVGDVEFDTIREAKEFYKSYQDVANLTVYGSNLFNYTYIHEQWPGVIDYDSSVLRVANIDIEVASENGFPQPEAADEEVVSITMEVKNRYFVWGCGDFENEDPNVNYMKCKGEKDLLLNFLDFWSSNYPDIITGWYIQLFDIPYLVNRITKLFSEKMANRLSPWGRIYERTINMGYGTKKQAYEIVGIAELDYLDLYKRYSGAMQESYKLDHISFVELGEKKLDYAEHGTLHKLYLNDYQKFIEYNIKDVALVRRIDDKMKLIEQALSVAYLTKVNLPDVHKQVRMWDAITHNHLLDKGVVVPPKRHHDKSDTFEGAYVKAPLIGKHRWIMSFDLASMYPHIIMMFNIGPDTIQQTNMDIRIEDLIYSRITEPMHDEFSVACNGSLYTKEFTGILSELMQEFYDGRTIAKGKMLDAKRRFEKTKDPSDEKEIARWNNYQNALKVTLNSAYGAMGSQYFRFYDLRNAEAITMSGQVIIRFIEDKLNKYLNKLLKTEGKDYVIASDTDSVYLRLDELVNQVFEEGTPDEKIVEFLSRTGKEKIEPYIDRCYQDLTKTLNGKHKMKMKREIIAPVGIWTNKKRYALNVLDDEGVRYSEPKMKVMGLEVVRSSTPQSCRTAIKACIGLMLTGTQKELVAHIEDFREKFYAMDFMDVAKPSGVNGIAKYDGGKEIFTKGTPFHVKGALVFNALLKAKKLTKQYDKVKEGEKIKCCYLKMPNTIQSPVLSVVDILPPEFGIEKYIDYELQFTKTFLDPVKNIAEVIGWKTDNSATLEDFFS
jgi:DNA polymerase elongation subunit (family B)